MSGFERSDSPDLPETQEDGWANLAGGLQSG